MAYLSDKEQQTVAWFKAIASEGASRCEGIKLDPLGSLALTLPPDADDERRAWLAYAAAQAKGKNAVVNDFIGEHGTLVLILPRYARPKQATMELTLPQSKVGEARRRVRQGGSQGPHLGAGEQSGDAQVADVPRGESGSPAGTE